MIYLFLKIGLQILAVTIAMLVSILNYVFHDKRSTKFKTGRTWLFILSVCFLVASIVITFIDGQNSENKEQALKNRLDIVQTQNDMMQKAVSALSEDQRSRFSSLFEEQRKVGTETATQIEGSANLLRDRIENSIALLNKSAKDINRAANPIRNIMIDVDLTTKLETSRSEVYRAKLEKAIFDLSKQKDGFKAIGMLYGRPPDLKLTITKVPYIPDVNNEPEVYYALSHVFLALYFYSNSVPVESLINGNSPPPDLQFSVAGSADNRIMSINPRMSSFELSYRLKDRLLNISGRNLASLDPQSTGKIIAIPDLAGAKMVIRVGGGFGGTDNPNTNSGIKEIYKSMKIADLTIRMSEGREFHINGEDLRQYTDPENELLYVYQFPTNTSLSKHEILYIH